MKAINWIKNFKEYKGLWVAMKKDQITVIASGKTLKETMEKAKEKGFFRPIFFRVPTEMIAYVGSFSKYEV